MYGPGGGRWTVRAGVGGMAVYTVYAPILLAPGTVLIKCCNFQRSLLARSISDPSVLATIGAYVFIFSFCCVLSVCNVFTTPRYDKCFHQLCDQSFYMKPRYPHPHRPPPTSRPIHRYPFSRRIDFNHHSENFINK